MGGLRHHRLNGHKFEQSLGDGTGQGNPECCSPWGHKELDVTERQTDAFWQAYKGLQH